MPITRAIAQYIFDSNVGLRYGTTTSGAAYDLMDIIGAGQNGGENPPSHATVLSWLQNPDSADFEPRWSDRLWNTCGKIIDLQPQGNAMLVSKASGSAERYLFNDPLAKGDRYTFRKCNRLQPDSQILANIPYDAERSEAADQKHGGHGPAPVQGVPAKALAKLDADVLAALSKLAGGR